MNDWPVYGSQDLGEFAAERFAEYAEEKSGWVSEGVEWLLAQAARNTKQAMESDDHTETVESMADAHCYLAMAYEIHEDMRVVPEEDQER